MSGANGGTARRSLAGEATVDGVGLHLGHSCRLTFRPGAPGGGVVFRRVDLPGEPTIEARADRAVLTERRTQLGEGAESLHTVEHVLAAVAGAGIDDLLIEMNAPEPPILDGSAKPFLDALRSAGVVERGGEAEYLELAAPVRVRDGDASYEAFPAPELRLDVTIDFPHPVIGRQRGEYVVTTESFASELAGARTFGFVQEVEALRAKGLIQGASTQNAIVLDAHGLVDTTLRWPDEFVRHKAMDCVGDLALAGKRVRARVVATKPSHRGTVLLVREMMKHAAPARASGSSVNTSVEGSVSERAKGGSGPDGAAAEHRQRRPLGVDEIMAVLPHRYPFLLVDRILELEPGKRVVGLKNVTINEPFFQGHFPGHPIMPGVLIIEAMAQVGGMLLLGAIEDPQSKVVYFTSLDNVKWRRPVKPGDQIRFEVEMVQVRGRLCKMRGVGYVDGEVVTEADMAAMVRDR